MNESDLHYMRDVQKDFFLHAIEEGAHLKIPPYYTQESWNRQIDILSMRLLGELSLGQIQQISEIRTPGQVSDQQLRGLIHLHSNASSDLQEEYPLASLTHARVPDIPRIKRTQSMTSRRKISESKGGASITVARQLEAGVPIAVVESNVPFSTAQLMDAKRRTLRKWGFDVYEMEKERDLRWITVLTNPNATYDEKKDVLDNITIPFYKKHRSDLFIALLNYLKKRGYHPEGDVGVFVIILEQNKDVPVGEVRNRRKNRKKERDASYAIHAMLSADIEKADEVLGNNQIARKYKQNPVLQVSGGSVDYSPNTGDIRRNPHYRSVAKFMKANGIGVDKRGHKLFLPNEFIQGAGEVPIWNYQDVFYFYDEDTEALRKYLFRRWDELKMQH